MTSKRDNRSLSSLDNQDTQTAIVMAEKRDIDLTAREYGPKSNVENWALKM